LRLCSTEAHARDRTRPAAGVRCWRLVIDVKPVETHVARILTKLDLHQTADEDRRVLAVLAWLRG